MTDASTPAIWRRLMEQTIGVLRRLATDDDANEHVNYCWWCQNDINGKDTQKQPHADDCPWVAARTLEAELDTALRACADALAPSPADNGEEMRNDTRVDGERLSDGQDLPRTSQRDR